MSKTFSHHEPVKLYPVDEIFDLIRSDELYHDFEVNGETYRVKIKSARFTCFMKNRFRCVSCGVKGDVVGLTFGGNPVPHLNLYHRNDEGELILMTKDHIIPRSKGGPNRQKNYQTMCCRCNGKKADKLVPALTA